MPRAARSVPADTRFFNACIDGAFAHATDTPRPDTTRGSQIFGGQSRPFRDSGQHVRPDLFSVMERKDEIRVSVS